MLKIRFEKKSLGIIVFIFSLILGILAFVYGRKITNFLSLGYLGVFLANMVGSATIIFPIPSLATTVAAGAFLNPVLTALFSGLGSTIGELTGYFAGRGGKEIIEKNGKIKRIEKWMEKYGLWTIFGLSVIPNPFFDIAGIISGASKIPIWKYLIIVFLGKLIKYLVLSFTGFGILKLI